MAYSLSGSVKEKRDELSFMPDNSGNETTRDYSEILASEIDVGLAALRRPAKGLWISGFSAGLDIGFSLFFMGTVLTLLDGTLPEAVVELLVANMYSIGFIFVILGRSELFTEHTTLAALPVLAGRARVSALARLWGLVYVSNLIGATLFAAFTVTIGPALGAVSASSLIAIGMRMVNHSWWVILLSAVLAGWMMGLLSWLVAAGRDTTSQLLIVWLITASIGLGGLHHSIVGTVEVMAAVLVPGGISFSYFWHFLLWSTLGNAIGGVFFVALIKYSHAAAPSTD